jgi:phage terminase Nu1 subunit (DNA packaging protein)
MTPYQPITKEDAARILSVSKRTIDNWLADGTIVQPNNIGRRLYWHPDVFYAWLDERLGVNAAPCNKGQRIVEPKQRGRPRATLH